MMPMLKQLVQSGDISYLSYYFAEFIAEQSNCDMDDLLVLSAALVSENNQQGDVCVALNQYQNRPLFSTSSPMGHVLPTGIAVLPWQQRLLDSPCVGRPGDVAPLILEHDRLYLSRFWFYETQVAKAILTRLNHPVFIDERQFIPHLKSLFPAVEGANQATDQMTAVAIAASHRFSIISGGPGTGKTTTVVKLLSLLLSQTPDMRIQLAAPTGKAAARLVDSIRARIDDTVGEDSIRSLIPTEASTIHRLLGYANQKFHYSSEVQLCVDCIVVDEASMIDLTLMYHLLDALPQHARVILLGDRDQLASVDAGSVLGDITGHGLAFEYTTSQTNFLDSIVLGSFTANQSVVNPEPITEPIANSIALLKHSYRFRSDSAIGQLASFINQGSEQQAIELLSTSSELLFWHNDIAKTLSSKSLEWVLDRYQFVIQAEGVNDALLAFENVRVLCAIHSGPFGINEINRLITARMLARGWIVHQSTDPYPDDHYHGQPILITQNDDELNLFNGDIGMIWQNDSGSLQAYFRCADGSLRDLPLQSLTMFQTAWAITIHKSQGSEFDTVLLILPDDDAGNRLSRELLYTAATRARQYLYVHASADSIITSCRTITKRHSGLAQKLGWKTPDQSNKQ